MSSIRLYILGSLAERGPLHGHALVALAEEEHVNEWTGISVGGLYGAARRPEHIRQYLNVAEWVAARHGIHRLEAELAWHEEFLAAVPDIIRDERNRNAMNQEDR